MARSKSAPVTEYLASLPPDRRKAVSAVRKVVKKHLPKGYVEHMGWGSITWSVPLKVYPTTYNGHPLCYAALANQKNYASLYLMMVYGNREEDRKLKEGFRKAGKKLDMGKSCVHFKSADDLALDAVAEAVASTPMWKWIDIAETSRTRHQTK